MYPGLASAASPNPSGVTVSPVLPNGRFSMLIYLSLNRRTT
jgi:hypothetical protein